MTETIDVEQAIETIEDGSPMERVDTFGTLSNLSHGQPDAFVPYIDDICQFADNEDPNIQSFVATILSNVARHDPAIMASRNNVVSSLLSEDDPNVLSFAVTTTMKITSVSPEVLLSETDRLFELLSYENTQEPRAARSIRLRTVIALTNLVEADSTLPAQLDEPLAKRLEDAESEVRDIAVITLTDLGIDYPGAVPTALSHLPARLDDPDPETRLHTVEAYVFFRHKQPDAIINPKTVAPAFKEAVDRVDVDEEDAEKVSETCRYLKELAAAQ